MRRLVPAPSAPGVGVVLALAGSLAPLAAQSAEWWAGIESMPSGFQTVEVDSVYRVSGSTREELSSAMRRDGPVAKDGARRLGLHVAQWRYSYDYVTGGETPDCRLTRARVLLRSVIILPDWAGAPAAPPELARGWRAFLGALRGHERGHRDRARAQGAMLWTALLGLAAPDCDALERRVRGAADRILAQGEAEQRRYDLETGHGATQGAVWP